MGVAGFSEGYMASVLRKAIVSGVSGPFGEYRKVNPGSIRSYEEL